MAVAHKDVNIPTLAGLDPHPALIAEQQRIAELRISDPALAAQLTGEAEAAAKASRRLPDAARDVLRQVALDLRKAAGLADKPAGGGGAPAPVGKPGDKPRDRAAAPNTTPGFSTSDRSLPGRTAGADQRTGEVVR